MEVSKLFVNFAKNAEINICRPAVGLCDNIKYINSFFMTRLLAMIKYVGSIILVLIVALSSNAASDLGKLEEALRNRPVYVDTKQARIDSIKHRMNGRRLSAEEKLKCYDELYEQYLTFRFDSAMAYLDRAELLLGENADYADKSRIQIHRALSLATSGHFSQAIELLKSINPEKLPIILRKELYSALQWTYGVWAEYSGQTKYAKQYNDMSIVYLDSLLAYVDKSSSEYAYHDADHALRLADYDAARAGYIKALENTPQDTRMYAQAAYGLAMAYKGMGDTDKYREWLINAAISDQITPLKENLALQELALDIKNNEGDLETANRYLKYSLEDAIFYNNRLRMLEISEKFPEIVIGYQDTVTAQNQRLKLFILIIGLLLVGLTAAVWLIVRAKKRLMSSRQDLANLNEDLKKVNTKLSQTNASREQYVSLFMDLCAAYIEKLNRFQATAVLKIKARQFDDLLRVANNNARPSEAELRELFFNFDTAFLKLYPDFVDRFNALLQPGKAILPRQNELLNTDLRIFALIRMGIKDSSKIAILLFYSPQTIFNHRTQVRNRAINRETFEQELMNICETIS